MSGRAKGGGTLHLCAGRPPPFAPPERSHQWYVEGARREALARWLPAGSTPPCSQALRLNRVSQGGGSITVCSLACAARPVPLHHRYSFPAWLRRASTRGRWRGDRHLGPPSRGSAPGGREAASSPLSPRVREDVKMTNVRGVLLAWGTPVGGQGRSLAPTAVPDMAYRRRIHLTCWKARGAQRQCLCAPQTPQYA